MLLTTLTAALTAAATLASVAPAGAQSGSVPGVSAKEVKVGAVIAKTNPTGIDYTEVTNGAQAYFDQVNKKGGVHGKQIKIVKVLDDQSRASKNILAARTLVEETKVFAAFQASQEFAGADVYVKAGTPVFGYNIQTQWGKGPNLFGTYGSYLCLEECPQWSQVFAAQQLGAKRVGIFAYGSSPQSAQCADVTKKAFERWGPRVGVFDTSISFGFSANDISGAVQALKENQVDFVTTCMDLQGVVNLRNAVEAAGLQGVRFYAPQGYGAESLDKFGDDVEGFTFLTQFVPFEAAKGNPGMTEFLKAMKAKGYTPSENYLVGWIGARLLVRGIEDAGKKFTQKSVVDAINSITDWTADSMMDPVNWKTAHGPAAPGETNCVAYVVVEKGKFVPKWGQPGKPMVCIPVNPYPPTLESPNLTYFGP